MTALHLAGLFLLGQGWLFLHLSFPCTPSMYTPQFLHNVSINLKEGGYFIGTVPDGKRINECIKT